MLTVRRDALASFREYERTAAAILESHGGRIERTVVVDSDPSAATLQEVHLVALPDASAFDAYRADPRLLALAPLRAASVVETRLLIGEDGPDYHDEG